MKALVSTLLAVCLLVASGFGNANSAVGQHYIDRIVNGGPSTVRDTARSIQKSGFADTGVLDVLAERVVQDYQKSGRTQVDAVAWAIIALGDSGNARYRQVLTDVGNTAIESKVAKHAKKAAKKLQKAGDVPQYTAGSISIEALRGTSAAPAQAAAPVAQNSGRYVPISQIQVGMSQAEAHDLAGPPTATTSHMTGKQFRPFNFKGSDTHRSYSLYKGQGRIVFSNESAYSSTSRVIEVILDTSETGYP